MKKGIQLLLITGLLLISQAGWSQSGSPGEGLIINENGNVGIGTASPVTPLHVMRTVMGNASMHKVAHLSLDASDPSSINNGFGTSLGFSAHRGTDPGSVNRTGAEIGTYMESGAGTYGDHWGFKIIVRDDDTMLTSMDFKSEGNIQIPNGNLGIGDPTPDARLDVIGSIHYTGSITDVSDGRLKENITPIRGALDIVQNINGVSFTMKDTPEKNETGFIAQNVQTYLPSAVNIIDKETGYLGVSYSDLIPVAFEAIKEQQEQIERLVGKVEELTQENRQLRHRLETIEENLNVSSN